MRSILLSLAILSAPALSLAQSSPQPGTSVQQSGTRLDAATNCQTATAAAAAAVTLTVSGVGSQSIYVTFLEITNYVSAAETGNAAPNLVTITGIAGAPIISMATAGATVGSVADRYQAAIGVPWKSSATGTNVVVTTPAFTGALWRVNLCYYYAP